MHKYFIGQRVLISRNRDGKARYPVPARVIGYVWDDGAPCDTIVRLLREAIIIRGGRTVAAGIGEKVYCNEDQLDPNPCESDKPARWEDCAWNPSMLKESNE